jgi:AbiTii
MSLLREIQDNAVGIEASVATLLRQCLVLASRLQNEELRESLFHAEVREGIAQIEHLLSAGHHTFQILWPADVVALLQRRPIYEGMVLMEAWQVIPATAYSSVLGGIRDRVLQFALDIERENPAAGEASTGKMPVSEARVTQIFHQNFYGDHAAVATGGRDVVQHVTISVDVDSLVAILRELGINKDEQEALVEAVREDQRNGSSLPGPQTRVWLARLQSGSIQLGSSMGVAAATDLILKLLHVS